MEWSRWNCGPNDGDAMTLLRSSVLKAGNLGPANAVEGVERTGVADLFMPPMSRPPLSDTPLLNVAEGPNSFSMFSNAPAAWTADKPLGSASDSVARAFSTSAVVRSKSGDVMRCNPGANCVGVDSG